MSTPKILIIDDSTTECLYMQQALQAAGYQTLLAPDGYQGIKMMLREMPDCLVLDIILPGMSGFEVCRQIRSQQAWKNLPIVCVSTKNSSSDRFWAMRQGANDYLPKPFKGEQLVLAVNGLLPAQAHKTPAPQAMPAAATSPDHGESASALYGDSQPFLALSRLIPRRYSTDNAWAHHVFSSLSTDPPAQRLFSAVDGQKNLEALVAATGLRRDDTLRVLRLLLKQRLIVMYEPNGRMVEAPFL